MNTKKIVSHSIYPIPLVINILFGMKKRMNRNHTRKDQKPRKRMDIEPLPNHDTGMVNTENNIISSEQSRNENPSILRFNAVSKEVVRKIRISKASRKRLRGFDSEGTDARSYIIMPSDFV
jgi:hypothetical protein